MLPVISNILYATDLSLNAKHALHYAASIAAKHGAKLTIMHVLPDELEMYSEQAGFDIAAVFGEEAAHRLDRGEVEKAKDAIHVRLVDTVSDCLHPETLIRVLSPENVIIVTGDPAQKISEEADTGRYQLLVLGTHGLSGWSSVVTGSVARQVTKHCPIPALIVPLPRELRKHAESRENAEAKA